MKKTAKTRIKIRLPLPKKAGHPQGTKKGKKGYRRKGRRVIDRPGLEGSETNG